jgi:hypothetical protein
MRKAGIQPNMESYNTLMKTQATEAGCERVLANRRVKLSEAFENAPHRE